MQLLQVELTNYRCFGPGTTTWSPSGLSQLLIGPSNGGKSTLGRAIESILRGSATRGDVYVAGGGQQMSLVCELGLSTEESVQFARAMFEPQSTSARKLSAEAWAALSVSFFARVRVSLTQTLDGDDLITERDVRTPVVILHNSTNILTVLDGGGGSISGTDVIDRWGERTEDAPLAPNEMKEWIKGHNAGSITTSAGAATTLLPKLLDGVRVLPEVRQRPAETANDSTETWTGDELPGVIGGLFGGSRLMKARYQLIKETFEGLHPGLGLDPQRVRNQWELRFTIPGLDESVPGTSIGMGTVQSLLIITNLLSSEHRVVVLEEPELHLHPPAIVALRPLIRKVAKTNQVIVLTHSPLLVDTASGFPVLRLEPYKRVDKVEGKDISELARLHPVWAREALVQACFARSVLITEGPYDPLMFSNLFAVLDPDWLRNEIAIAAVDGKKGVLGGYEFLRKMEMEPIVCMDNDALTVRDTSYNGMRMSAALAQAARADILDPDELQELVDYHGESNRNSPYPVEFVDTWRTRLRDRSWHVLSDSLDRLVLLASGRTPNDSKRGKTDRNREAEELSRSLPRESVPAEVAAIFDELKSR